MDLLELSFFGCVFWDTDFFRSILILHAHNFKILEQNARCRDKHSREQIKTQHTESFLLHLYYSVTVLHSYIMGLKSSNDVLWKAKNLNLTQLREAIQCLKTVGWIAGI